ncbi:MAG TPA: GGDEF domain-containing protein [Acidimicrobiales bacterium]|nr:GGDEF domain-containing protein [Acidimicrobiales bacterium]
MQPGGGAAASHPRPRLEFKGELDGPNAAASLRSVVLLFLLLPVSLIVAFAYRPGVRSWPALWTSVGLAAVLLARMAYDAHQLRQGHLETFRPGLLLLEVVMATAAYGALAVAVGFHNGVFLLVACTPFLLTSIVGGQLMMDLAWLALVTTLAIATGLQLPALDTAFITGVFAAVFAVIGVMIDLTVRGIRYSADVNQALAEVASHASNLREWPQGLAPIAQKLAFAMNVDRYAVITRAPHGRPERDLIWPNPEWADWTVLGDLPERALSSGHTVTEGELYAVPALSSGAGLVMVVPTHVHGVPVDTNPAVTAAALLATMRDRALVVAGLVDLANSDALTGVANRRKLFEVLPQELVRAGPGKPLSVVMIDLDHFKQYNDRFGHTAGDQLLRLFAERVTARLRGQDLVARFGGEEFVLVLPDTDIDSATLLVEAVRSLGAGADPDGNRVTFSAGIAAWDGAESVDDLVLRADTSLYAAKFHGRDRVMALP